MERFLTLLLLSVLAACAAPNRVVLLGGDEGAPSALVVSNAGGSAVLDRPGAAVEIARSSSAPKAIALGEAEIQKDWADAIAYHPPRPVTMVFYFVLDTTNLTRESRADLPRLLDLIRQRPAPEVVIIGHTDRSGDPRYNYELGLRRATAVQRDVEAVGVPTNLITVASHGAGNPLIETKSAYEPRNRRVEITVR